MFDKAKAKSKKATTAKKSDKTIVTVAGEEFAKKLKTFAELQKKLKDMESELKMSQAFVKEVAIEEYAKLIETKKSNPGSFVVKSEEGSECMVVPTKRYIKVVETSAENLKETYGEDIVTEDTTYGFNTDVLMRNMETIEALLMGSEDISDEDKENLIVATTNYAIEKDALDKVYTLAKETEMDVKDVIDDIQPIVQMKNPKA